MLRTLSAPQTPRPESEKLIKLKITQDQVGHCYASTTALYTSVSSDFRNRALRAALDRSIQGALGGADARGTGGR
jgi:hypothetical protein